MRKLAFRSIAISLLLTGSAAAADLRTPVKSPTVVAPVASYNWTGCYVGAGGGYGMFRQKTQFLDTGVPDGLSQDNGGSGWFGTAQVGCDYQFGSNIVIGAFGDYDFSGIKGDAAVHMLAAIGEEKLKNSWGAGARIGWLPFNQLMVFVSGGYTQARFDGFELRNDFNGAFINRAVSKHTYSGWFIGSGYEYAMGWLPGFYWKTEYRFADYGTENVAINFASGAPTPDESIASRKYIHTVRSELVWRFNFGGPVVARY